MKKNSNTVPLSFLAPIHYANWLRTFGYYVFFILLLLTTIFSTAQAHSYDDELVVKLYSVEMGLSQSVVSTVMQDSHGFVWIGTEAGVNRFDGNKFTHFLKSNSNGFSIVDDQVTHVSEDHQNNIWIATSNGISIYDPHSGEIEHFSPQLTPQIGFRSFFITSIIHDNDNNTWVATLEGGLYKYDMANRRFEEIALNTPNLEENDFIAISTMLLLTDGRLLIGTFENGVLTYHPSSNRTDVFFYEKEGIFENSNRILSLFQDDNDTIWLGSHDGLVWINPKTNTINKSYHDSSLKDVFEDESVDAITQDRQGNIWAAVYNKGIFLLSPTGKLLKHYYSTQLSKYGLPNNTIKSLTTDVAGRVWLGTDGYGVALWSPTTFSFHRYISTPNKHDSIINHTVWEVIKDQKNNLWVTTDNGITKISEQEQFSHIEYQEGKTNSLTDPIIYSATINPLDNTLWASAFKYVDVFNLDTRKKIKTIDVISQSTKKEDVENFILKLKYYKGHIWFGTTNGLFRYNLKDESFSHYYHDENDPKSLTDAQVYNGFYTDHQGRLWIMSDNGLNLYNEKEDNFQRFLDSADKNIDLDPYTITGITETKPNYFWISYMGSGLKLFDINESITNPRVLSFTIKDGLSTNAIYSLISDSKERLWLGTMRGLQMVDPVARTTRLFTIYDGLSGEEFNEGAAFKDNKGRLYFGTTNGVTSIDPDEIDSRSGKNLTFVESIVHTEKESIVTPILEKKRIVTSIDSYAIDIIFSDFDFSSPFATKYLYQLEGLHKSWISLGLGKKISLGNLPPGEYKLKLKSTHGIDSATLEIIIPAPFSQTPLAYFLYVVFAAILLMSLYYLRRHLTANQRAVQKQLDLFAEAVKNTTEGVVIFTRDRHIVAINEAAARITGYGESDVINMDIARFTSAANSPQARDKLWHKLNTTGNWNGETTIIHADGEVIPIEATVSEVKYEKGEQNYFVAVFSDITERLKHQHELQQLANFDTLTGLPNRTLLNDRLQHSIAHAHRESLQLAVMFLDLDRFKQVNDTLGHDVGDLLLIGVAERISKEIREDDTFARLGGDEFILVIEEFHELSQVVNVAQRINTTVSELFHLRGYDVSTSTSIGIAVYPEDGKDISELLKNADIAMYHAKAQGKNNFQFFSNTLNEEALERLELENILRKAIEHNYFHLVYQPRVDSKTGEVQSLEVLLRLIHPDLGFISPAKFIPIAEESGIIVAISEWVFQQSCKQLNLWRQDGLTSIGLSINLSARLFQSYDLVKLIINCLNDHDLDAKHVELEITESLLMANMEETVTTLSYLQALGCKVSVDDFGTGYSSLSYLHKLPVNTLKIDRSFVSEINNQPDINAIVDIIINLAKSLRLEIVAEGVETQEQFNYLKNKGCEQIQGYYFARPLPVEEVKNAVVKGYDV
ncbi:EAL domain-containing protein [Flocculibacter collagenilyticus]|uniref:EAL domain-containing protein n=1 Tax=Flocculibacter collagenilyticus TaxID=2744479 RepID=UPI0018F6295C|nr:EAL domain-containing protein [Flocculibacter collagenilyticus]